MKKEMTIQEWKQIGEKAKEVQRNLMDLADLLKGKLSKTVYLNKWFAAEKAFGKLRSHLDDLVCNKFPNIPDREVTHIFYGDDKN